MRVNTGCPKLATRAVAPPCWRRSDVTVGAVDWDPCAVAVKFGHDTWLAETEALLLIRDLVLNWQSL